MPRLTTKPPAYLLHKASGQAKARYRGKDHYFGRFGSPESREAYARFLANLPELEAPAPAARPDPDLPVSVLILRYFRYAEAYYVKNGVPTGEHVTVRSSLRPLLEMFGDLPGREFGPKRLKEVREAMIKMGWSRYYINKATGIIRRCFTWCASEELVDANTALALRTVQGLRKGRTAAREKPPVLPVPDEILEATLPFLSDLAADVIRLMRLTGARPGEIVGLSAKQIDRTDPECWRCDLVDHKTAHHEKSRVIFVGPRGQEILKRRILKAGRGPLFPIDRTSLYTAVCRACKRAGVPPWSPNRVRHLVGTEIRARYGLEAAQVLLGHTHANVTQIYAERNERHAAEVARKIG
jgi:integrase